MFSLKKKLQDFFNARALLFQLRNYELRYVKSRSIVHVGLSILLAYRIDDVMNTQKTNMHCIPCTENAK